ncbi:MAG: dTDP-4-dehydrorhamnose 3,5-epimerase [Candidatus Parvarchaeota archaeon]
MPLNIQRTEIPEVLLISSEKFSDDRGFFIEKYKRSDLKALGIDLDFVQMNHSFSKRGVLRGLHFQRRPKEQDKLVTVTRGKIMDVAVDIRPSSPTYKKYIYATLSEENNMSIFIPKGFAHGFLALEESDVVYLTTTEYSSEHDSGIRWDDPDININWPIKNPIVSKKDRGLKYLSELIKEGVLQQ